MKKFKFRKKEYLVFSKDELDPILRDIAWRLNASRTTSEVIARLHDGENRNFEIEYLGEKINECCDILDKFEESL